MKKLFSNLFKHQSLNSSFNNFCFNNFILFFISELYFSKVSPIAEFWYFFIEISYSDSFD